MKRLILGSLSFLLFAGITATVVQAQTQAINSATSSRALKLATQVTPFELVTMAHQGYFIEQGIPSYMMLVSDYQRGTLSAKDLVEAGIRANKLSPEFSTDRSFLNAVDLQLQLFAVR
jgi:hypothetical protein